MAEISWLDESIYRRRSGDVYAPWAASHAGHALKLWLGDFPAESLYTLLVDEVEVLSLDDWPAGWKRMVVLRDENDGQDRRSLWAYVEQNGDFVLDGQDLGPAVERVFGAGLREYEWKRIVPASEVPRLLQALGATGDSDVLNALEVWLTTHESGHLEKLLQERNVESTFWSRIGD